MPKPAEIHIVRHAQTDYNLQGIIQGRGVDAHLNEAGKKQALAFFHHYSHLSFDEVCASSQTRTYQTIHHFETLGYQISRHPQLDEIGWGAHEGKSPTPAMNQEYKRLIAAWQNGDTRQKVLDGESPSEVQYRIHEFLKQLFQHSHNNVLICTHGRTARILICTLMKTSLDNMQSFTHTNTGLTKMRLIDSNYELEFLNNTDHLTT